MWWSVNHRHLLKGTKVILFCHMFYSWIREIMTHLVSRSICLQEPVMLRLFFVCFFKCGHCVHAEYTSTIWLPGIPISLKISLIKPPTHHQSCSTYRINHFCFQPWTAAAWCTCKSTTRGNIIKIMTWKRLNHTLIYSGIELRGSRSHFGCPW